MLRPELFKRLRSCYPEASVVAENEDMKSHYVIRGGRHELIVDEWGEAYRINCPHCNDTRRRLWISHQWGLKDETTKSLNLFLCMCFNEKCFQKQGRAKLLYDLVFSEYSNEDVDVIRRGVEPTTTEVVAELPGHLVQVNDLQLSHPARRYLTERGFDVNYLVDVFHVQLCVEAFPKFRMTQDRLILPIYSHEKLVGWQARCVGDPPRGVPKYYTMPGMRKTRVLYNIDRARQHPFVVVCEGPTDVWSFGPEAVALFGKTVSRWQLGTIATVWQKAYIVLDGDALVDAQGVYDGLGDKIEKVLVELPKNQDPGSIPTPLLRDKVLGSGVSVR